MGDKDEIFFYGFWVLGLGDFEFGVEGDFWLGFFGEVMCVYNFVLSVWTSKKGFNDVV